MAMDVGSQDEKRKSGQLYLEGEDPVQQTAKRRKMGDECRRGASSSGKSNMTHPNGHIIADQPANGNHDAAPARAVDGQNVYFPYIMPPHTEGRHDAQYRKDHRPGDISSYTCRVGGGLSQPDEVGNANWWRRQSHDVLEGHNFREVNRMMKLIIKTGSGDVIVAVFLKSNILAAIVEMIKTDTGAGCLTATLLCVLPYVRSDPNESRHGIRRVSDMIRKDADAELIFRHLALALRQHGNLVSVELKTFVFHAFADLSEAIYEATKSRAEQPRPISNRYHLAYQSLQILMCPTSNLLWQAFSLRILITHMKYGAKYRRELVDEGALGIIARKLPVIGGDGSVSMESRRSDRGDEPSRARRFHIREQPASGVSFNGHPFPPLPTSGDEKSNDDDETIELYSEERVRDYTLILVMQFLYDAHSYDEFVELKESDYVDSQGSATHGGTSTRGTPPEGIFTPELETVVRDRCERLSRFSKYYEVRAAARMVVTYGLSEQVRVRVGSDENEIVPARDPRGGKSVAMRCPKWAVKFTDFCEDERATMNQADEDPYKFQRWVDFWLGVDRSGAHQSQRPKRKR